MPNSLSDLHTLHAWEDNQITERCTQGEYAGKVLQFKLVDKDGAIDLTNCIVQYAVTRPDKTEDLLDCTVDNGVVKCNLTYSVTSISGLVHGEVRVIGSNNSGTIKFYGVNLCVYKGVSDEAAEQSDEFTALVAALQKVVSITPDPDSENTYVVRLDDSIVQNGLNPVASGTIYDYLQGNYRQISFAHENNESSYDDGGVYIDNATDITKMYYVKNSNGARVGILFCVRPLGYNYASQVKIDAYSNITTRVKTKESGEADYTWKSWTPIGTTRNIQDGAVTSDKIANGAITALKIANGAVSGSNIAQNQISTNHLQSGTVTTDKLGEDVINLFSELKDDLDKLNDDVLATSMWEPVNFRMEIGTLNLAGTLIDNTTRIRTTDWISIDNITVLCKKPEHINDCVITNILCRNSEGEISNIPSSQFNGKVGYNGFKILTDTTCAYKFTVGYADNREITDILGLMNYINFIDIKGITSLDYTEKIFEINGIRGCIKDGDTISFGFEGSGQVMSPFIYTFNTNGTLNIDNPNSYSVILYKIDNNLNKLDRIVSTNVSAKFDIEENALYMINIYKSGLTSDAYVPMLARFCNPYSKVTELDTKVTELDTKVIELDSKVTEIPLTWEQGSFNAVGYDASNTVNLRTEKIETDEDSTYIFTVPNTLRCLACYSFDGNNRKNFDGRTNGFTIKNNHGFIRIAIRYLDGSDITYDGLTDTEKSQIHLYKVESKGDYDVTISSSKKFKAMFTVDGENCQHLLQALVSSLNSIKIKLYSGEYHLNSLYTSVRSGQQSFLQTTDLALNYHLVQIDGEYCSTRTGDSESTRIIIDYDESLMDDSTSYAGILVPRLASSEDDKGLTKVILSINGIKIIGNTYKKKMVYIDATHAQAFNATNVEVRADGSISGLIRFPTKPNEDCVGIRAGYGSNNGIQNYIKNCMVYYCGKGYSICGEHYILQDNLAHHCYIGFAFGDRLTRGNYEHPNIMIGCSIEGCYRLMLLSRYGETEESDAEYCTNTLICIGTSTELYWEIPTDELVDGKNDKSITLPIKEVIKGVYRGRVEIDYPRSPFEEGSGEYMKYTSYWKNGIKEGIGSN